MSGGPRYHGDRSKHECEAAVKKKDVTASRRSRAPNDSAETLPKIKGAVCAQWRVYKGKRLGPYYFLYWREGGKLRKRYVRPADLAATVAACAAHRDEMREERRSREEVLRWIRKFNRADREIERLLKLARPLR